MSVGVVLKHILTDSNVFQKHGLHTKTRNLAKPWNRTSPEERKTRSLCSWLYKLFDSLHTYCTCAMPTIQPCGKQLWTLLTGTLVQVPHDVQCCWKPAISQTMQTPSSRSHEVQLYCSILIFDIPKYDVVHLPPTEFALQETSAMLVLQLIWLNSMLPELTDLTSNDWVGSYHKICHSAL